ncbi:phosphohydrolase [Virgibacillus halodenitrificans]|uniref:Phosphohydrolase n=1 Tax=Virgibacillus halodenitrificans TaxID=1482 RepID=A0AAC9NIM5_VIRHA|nr:HD domain-containing protein [Virgibacillus halodenitrificans]APC47017.1 phosphohydrolase [Virgibacillus halodenitrificans]
MKERAKAFAIKAHEGQVRKNSKAAYVTHPIRVAERLEKAGFSDELVSAAYLHDVVEDTPYVIEDIEREFGPQVAQFVAAHTEDKSKSWKERKQHTINTVLHADREIKCLIIADKLDNILGLEEDMEVMGNKVWENFNAGREDQKWYNSSIVAAMYHGLNEEETPAYFNEYEQAVKRVFD